ncbi:hypothetical protein ACIBG8_09645 [Nonomuraea sp. NPDC050556]|uniref:hypothetical protein n=1 Tax=Nonomuraea sp. NPDC050556 TaxID=3364369 RepID=UPI0037B7D317
MPTTTRIWAAAAAAVGVLVPLATSMRLGWAEATLIPSRIEWGPYALVPTLVPVMAVIAGLVLIRWWSWLLAAGTLLCVPMAAALYLPSLGGHTSVNYFAQAGGALTLVAVLGAAQELMAQGKRAWAATIAGSAVGAGVVAAALLGATWLRADSALAYVAAVPTLLAVMAAVLALVLHPGAAAFRPSARVTVLGSLAALLAFVPAFATPERISSVLEVSLASLGRRPYILVAVIGLAILAAAALLAAITGPWAGPSAAGAALVQVGVVVPLLLTSASVAHHPGYGTLTGLAGFAAGCAAGASRWRTQLAVTGGVLSALLLLLALAATGGEPEKIVSAAWIPGGLLLAVLVATVTCTVASCAEPAALRGGLPAVLGPIAGALVIGGRYVSPLTQLNDGEPASGYLGGSRHLEISAGLLLAAALVVAALALASALRRNRSRVRQGGIAPSD